MYLDVIEVKFIKMKRRRSQYVEIITERDNSMIEEFMLLANITWEKKFTAVSQILLLLRHLLVSGDSYY